MNFFQQRKVMLAYYQSWIKPVYEKYGLTEMEFQILMFLRLNPEMNTAAEIVKTENFTKSHVSSSIKHLVEMGLVEQRYENHNRKTIRLYLSESSKEVVEEGRQAQEAFYAELTKGISEEELHYSEMLMNRMYQNIKNK